MKSCLVHVSFLPLTSVAFPPLRNGWGGRNCLFSWGGRDGRSGCNGWGGYTGWGDYTGWGEKLNEVQG